MSGLPQIPTDYKKYLDQSLHFYLASVKNAKQLFNQRVIDSGQITQEYVRQTQSYSSTKGFTSFDDPGLLADGARPPKDSIGTEDATSTPLRYGKAFEVDVATLNSGVELVQQFISRHTVERVQIIDNYINRLLITNMASNAGQSYTATGGTWSTTGDAVYDVVTAKAAFKVQAGGMDADFLLINPITAAQLGTDQRFQSTLFTSSKSIETGKIVPNPFGLEIIEDQAVTAGTFFMGKKGMFADLLVAENYLTFETDIGAAGKQYEITYKAVDQYKLPYYLMYGTGV